MLILPLALYNLIPYLVRSSLNFLLETWIRCMAFKVEKSDLEGVLIIEPVIHIDPRGSFFESFQKERYKELGIVEEFVQDNQSVSQKHTIRGLHYRVEPGQSKLVRVIRGEVFDVVVDIRKNSSTFGQWRGYKLSDANYLQIYIPAGFAHGFCVLSESAEFLYKVSEYYAPEKEKGIMWNDPEIGIEWPTTNPFLSEKDKGNPALKDL